MKDVTMLRITAMLSGAALALYAAVKGVDGGIAILAGMLVGFAIGRKS